MSDADKIAEIKVRLADPRNNEPPYWVDVEHLLDVVQRLCTRIADLTTRDEQAVLSVARVLMWCDEQDALSKGPSLTTIAVRAAVGEVSGNPVTERIVALWNGLGGWIPGAAYSELAEALGVETDRLIHYNQKTRTHHKPEVGS